MTKNIKLVLLSISCVIMSIVITLGISQVIFGGIELVMIITPGNGAKEKIVYYEYDFVSGRFPSSHHKKSTP